MNASFLKSLHQSALQLNAGNRLSLLQQCADEKINSATQARNYYYTLLFISGYATDAVENNLVISELHRTETYLSKQNEFVNAQLPCSKVIAGFSLQLCHWMIEERMNAKVHSFGADNEVVINIFKMLLPSVARDERDNPEIQHALNWLKKISGKENPLKVLLKWFDAVTASDEVKENLFQQLQLFVQVKTKSWLPDLNFPSQKIHFTSAMQKHIDVKEFFSRNKIEEAELSLAQQLSLCSNAKNVLMTLLRETDPVTHALPASTKLFRCGYGVSVVLFSMQIEKRLAVESYLGYVAYKNNLPLAYGGAWITGHHARIGINIFPWFRGGESTRSMAQLMQVYHKCAGVKTFTVEPYQIGKGNSDGIKSGAFWFYYRLGFRPQQTQLNQLAETEWKKISNNKNYRTSVSVLKQLSHSNLFFCVDDHPQFLSSKEISEAIQTVVAKNYNGDFLIAQNAGIKSAKNCFGASLKKFNTSEKFALIQLAPLLACLPLNQLTKNQLQEILQLIKSKAAIDETNFIKQWQQSNAWNKQLQLLLNF